MTIEALPYRLLRLPQVLDTVGLSRSAIYTRIRKGNFPKPISLGGTSVAWLESEVLAWLDARIVASPDGEARLHRSRILPRGDTSNPESITVQCPAQPVKPKRDDAERKRADDRRRNEKLDTLLAALRDYLIDLRVNLAP